MAIVYGAYDCVTRTPMGDQQSVFTVISNDGTFHGTNASPLGSLDVKGGKVDGNRLTWKMEMNIPMPMTLEAEAIIEGDTLTCTIAAGAFGALDRTGKKRPCTAPAGGDQTERRS